MGLLYGLKNLLYGLKNEATSNVKVKEILDILDSF